MCEQTTQGQDDTVEIPDNSWPEPQEGGPWAEVRKELREECLGENVGNSALGMLSSRCLLDTLWARG